MYRVIILSVSNSLSGGDWELNEPLQREIQRRCLRSAGLWAGAVQESPCSAAHQSQLAALNYARLLNIQEATLAAVLKRHGPMPQLGSPDAPDGFQVQRSSDGLGYTFSIKDMLDACHWALFSDQQGVIYAAQPLGAVMPAG